MNFGIAIQEALQRQASLLTLREIVCQYKHSGGTQQEAYTTLENLRDAQPEEAYEDLILELMDMVAGFCSPVQRIWDAVLVS